MSNVKKKADAKSYEKEIAFIPIYFKHHSVV